MTDKAQAGRKQERTVIISFILIILLIVIGVLLIGRKHKSAYNSQGVTLHHSPTDSQTHESNQIKSKEPTRSRTATVSGMVIDVITGDPISASHLTAENRHGHQVTALSDISGRYSLEIPRGQWTLWAQKESYGIRETTLAIASQDPVYHDFYLLKEALVFGHIRYSDGDAVKEMEISAHFAGKHADILKTRTDAAGYFEIGQITPGRLLELRLIESAQLYRTVSIDRLKPGQKYGPINIVLDRGCSISGKVVSASSRMPVFGIDIRLRHSDPLIHGDLTAVTDENGWYRFKSVPPGQVVLKTCTRDYWHSHKNIEKTESGRDYSVDFDLEPPVAIHGSVRTSAGDPLEGLTICILDAFCGHDHGDLTAESDFQGNFIFDSITGPIISTSNVVFTFEETELPSILSKEISLQLATLRPGDSVEIHLTLPICAETVYGRITDIASAPVSDAQVTLQNEVGRIVDCAVTASDGFFQFTGMRFMGCHDGSIEVKASGFAWAEKHMNQAVTTRDGLRMDMQLVHGDTISGRVTDEAETPLEGFVVSVNSVRDVSDTLSVGLFSDLRSSLRSSVSSQTGAFELTGLAAGSYTLQVDSPVSARLFAKAGVFEPSYTHPDPVEPGNHGLLVVIPQGGTIILSVVHAETREPVTQYNVSLTSLQYMESFAVGDRSQTVSVRNLAGRCRVSNVPFGDLSLAVRQNNAVVAQKTVSFTASASPLNLTLEAQSGKNAVFGHVFARRDRIPLPNCMVSMGFRSADGAPPVIQSARTGADGRFEMQPVRTAGECDIRVVGFYDGREIHHSETRLLSDDNSGWVILVDIDGAVLYGRVIDHDTWLPIEQADITAGPILTGLATHQARSDQYGFFTLEALPDGDLFIRCVHPEYRQVELRDISGTHYGDSDRPLIIELVKE
ncbi:MAG: carboxypeptidase-like regulatory domain-containing protein [bacterium]